MNGHDATISLRELIDERFKSLEAKLDQQVKTHGLVHSVAEGNVNRRLDEMNLLREQINAERGSYVTMSVLDARFAAAAADYHKVAESNAGRIALLEQQASNWQGRFWMAGVGITFAMTAIALAVKFL